MDLRTLVPLFIFFFPCLLAAQSGALTLRGTVSDAQTGEKLPFVHITYAGYQYGTTTNEYGAFRVTIPFERRRDTIRFSFLGYEPFLLPLAGVGPADKPLDIRLPPAVFDLPALEVTPVAARELVRTAIRRLKKNYHITPYRLRGFYRETGRQPGAGRVVLFAEGVIQVEKDRMWAYGRKVNRDPVRIIKGYRRKLDYSLLAPDSTLCPLPPISQGAHLAVRLDVVREPTFFLDKQQYRAYDYSYEGREFLAGKELLRIRFEPAEESVAQAPYRGELWIEKESHAIVRLRYSYTDQQVARYNLENAASTLALSHRSFAVQYFEYQGQWFLESARIGQSFRHKIANLPLAVTMNFITTGVEEERLDARARDGLDEIDYQAVFAERVEAVGEGYWEEYNILEPLEEGKGFR